MDTTTASAPSSSQPGAPPQPQRESLYCGAHGRHAWALVWGVLAMASTCGQGLYLNGWYAEHGYKSYYLLCWFTQSFLIIVFPLWFLGELIVGGAKNCSKERSWGLQAFGAGASAQARESLLQCKSVFVPSGDLSKSDKAKTLRYRVTMWCLMAAFNFFSSYLWYWSFAYVTVTANQALYSTLNVFVFLSCAVCRAERVTLPKVAAVLVSLGGSVILCLSPEAARPGDDGASSSGAEAIEPGRWAAGCVLVIVAAFTYSIFEICYQKGVGLRDARVVMLSQSAMGLFVLTVLWIPMLIVFETHAEPVPPVGHARDPVVGFLFVNVVFAVWYYVSYAFGITTGEPTYITIFTTIVSILIAVVMDRCQNGIVPSSSQGWGIGVLVLGALLSNIRNIKRVPIVDLDLIEWSRQAICGKKRRKEEKEREPEKTALPPQVGTVESPVHENRVDEAPGTQALDEPVSVVVPDTNPSMEGISEALRHISGRYIGPCTTAKKVPFKTWLRRELPYVTPLQKLGETSDVQVLISSEYVHKGEHMKTAASAEFIEFYGIDIDFITREVKPGRRPVASPGDPSVFVSTADPRLTLCDSIDDARHLLVKGKRFSFEKLVRWGEAGRAECAGETLDGIEKRLREISVANFRLVPQDYHRYHAPVAGRVSCCYRIPGMDYDTEPVALASDVDVLGENERVVAVIEGELVVALFIAIGASSVGTVHTAVSEGDVLLKEAGWFDNGGRDIVAVFDRKVKWDPDIVLGRRQETLVQANERIGAVLRGPEP
eukprot:m51a1_g1511 hypothetical protein (773) ;mRNA; f:403414-406540